MKMDKRRVWRVIAIVIALGIVGAQWWARKRHVADSEAGATGIPAAASTEVSRPVGKPAPPATLKMGRLTLTACELKRPHSAATLAAFCTKFPVPENRADPESRTIDLKLAILKSDSTVPARDLVVYLAGGPGQSAIQTYPDLAPAFAPLLKHHDVLLLDQRGTGDSHPLKCPALEKLLKDQADAAQPGVEQRAQWVGECAQEVEKSADPRYYATSDAVADLEAVRAALGAPRLDLVGVSYGTRMAQHYAAAHPDAVRSIVLDGVVPNSLVLGETFATGLQQSLKLQAQDCDEAAACKQAFGDWYATLHQLYVKLRAGQPQQVTFEDPYSYQPVTRALTADTLAGVVRLFSYSEVTAALLPLAVNEAARGNYAPLMGQAQLLSGDLSGSIESGMQMSVICTEDAPLLTPRPQDEGLLLGDELIKAFIAECKAWPHNPMPQGFHTPFKSSIPTLLISGERDPVTPPAFAGEVLKGLSNGRSLVVRGLGHAEAINVGCMPKLVDTFIADLQPEKLQAQCLDRIRPIPAFVNFNGAAP